MNEMRMLYFVAGLLLVSVALTGCEYSAESAPSIDGSRFLLTTEPEGALDVLKARESAQDDDDVVVIGRIGGSENPWVDGRAAFTIVDRSLTACSDREGDNCLTPWDYCCEPELAKATVSVRVVDENGDIVPSSAKELLQLKELDTVVVRGKAERDADGNLKVLASNVYVKK